MDIQFGDGKTKYGPGVLINLSGDEVAIAVYAYLTAHSVHINGAATIYVNGELCEEGHIYVDPSAKVVYKGVGWDGRGTKF